MVVRTRPHLQLSCGVYFTVLVHGWGATKSYSHRGSRGDEQRLAPHTLGTNPASVLTGLNYAQAYSLFTHQRIFMEYCNLWPERRAAGPITTNAVNILSRNKLHSLLHSNCSIWSHSCIWMQGCKARQEM